MPDKILMLTYYLKFCPKMLRSVERKTQIDVLAHFSLSAVKRFLFETNTQ